MTNLKGMHHDKHVRSFIHHVHIAQLHNNEDNILKTTLGSRLPEWDTGAAALVEYLSADHISRSYNCASYP